MIVFGGGLMEEELFFKLCLKVVILIKLILLMFDIVDIIFVKLGNEVGMIGVFYYFLN